MRVESYQYGGVTVYMTNIPACENLSRRECERKAEAELIRQLLGDKDELIHDEDGKPYLKDRSLYISVSHSKSRLCIALSENREAGVDIEDLHPRIERVKHMFLTEAETACLPTGLTALALCWSAKEAVYKIAGKKAGAMAENVKLDVEALANALNQSQSMIEFSARVGDERFRLAVLEHNEEFEIVLACRYMNRY